MKLLSILLGLAGGLGLFIFGMQMCSEGLQKIAARRIKHLLKGITKYPVFGLGIGAVVTLAIQSSSATSALVIGFVSAGLLNLSQALSVLLGSAVGASMTAQLIAFRTTNIAFFLLFTGSGLYIFSKRLKHRSLGQAILGFGLIFYGMIVMSSAVEPLRDNEMLSQILIRLEDFPLFEFFFGMLITAIFQSSAAFIALLMTLASHQLIGVYSIIPYILGAHLGGTITGVVSSFGITNIDSKRAAYANFGFKLINGLVFLPFYRPLTAMIFQSSPNLNREIANAHTLFSLIMAIGFLPLTPKVALMMKRFFQSKQPNLGEARFLQKSLLEVPELAIDQAQRQTVEMGRLIRELMLEKVLPLLKDSDDITIRGLKDTEKAIDALYQQISRFLAGLGNNLLSEELMERTIKILNVSNDLEHIGDVVINITQIAEKMDQQEVQFSEAGFEELATMYQLIHKFVCEALVAFETNDRELATRVIQEYPRTVRLEKVYRYNHFDRMQSGNPKTVETSAVHLDLIEGMLRINGYAVNIAQSVLGIV